MNARRLPKLGLILEKTGISLFIVCSRKTYLIICNVWWKVIALVCTIHELKIYTCSLTIECGPGDQTTCGGFCNGYSTTSSKTGNVITLPTLGTNLGFQGGDAAANPLLSKFRKTSWQQESPAVWPQEAYCQRHSESNLGPVRKEERGPLILSWG